MQNLLRQINSKSNLFTTNSSLTISSVWSQNLTIKTCLAKKKFNGNSIYGSHTNNSADNKTLSPSTSLRKTSSSPKEMTPTSSNAFSLSFKSQNDSKGSSDPMKTRTSSACPSVPVENGKRSSSMTSSRFQWVASQRFPSRKAMSYGWWSCRKHGPSSMAGIKG